MKIFTELFLSDDPGAPAAIAEIIEVPAFMIEDILPLLREAIIKLDLLGVGGDEDRSDLEVDILLKGGSEDDEDDGERYFGLGKLELSILVKNHKKPNLIGLHFSDTSLMKKAAGYGFVGDSWKVYKDYPDRPED